MVLCAEEASRATERIKNYNGDGVARGYCIRSSEGGWWGDDALCGSEALLRVGSGFIEWRLKRKCLSPVGNLLGVVEAFGRGVS